MKRGQNTFCRTNPMQNCDQMPTGDAHVIKSQACAFQSIRLNSTISRESLATNKHNSRRTDDLIFAATSCSFFSNVLGVWGHYKLSFLPFSVLNIPHTEPIHCSSWQQFGCFEWMRLPYTVECHCFIFILNEIGGSPTIKAHGTIGGSSSSSFRPQL